MDARAMDEKAAYPTADVHQGGQQGQIPQGTPIQVQGVPVQAQPYQTHTVTMVQMGGPNQVVRGDMGYYDRFPRKIVCQFCNYEVITGITVDVGLGTWLICCGMAVVGCVPCCLIPFCFDDMKDVNHHCPNCHRLVGAKRLI